MARCGNPATAMPLPRKKLALIHVAKARLGLDDADYRALLNRAAGVTSASALDDEGFSAVLAELTRLGFQSTMARANLGNRAPWMASPQQVALIRKLWAQVSEGGDERGLNTWLERKFKISALRFLPADKVSAVAHGLKQWLANEARKRRAAP